MSLIYIVEDDKNILEIESFALKNSGFDIRGFGCAKDKGRQIYQNNP